MYGRSKRAGRRKQCFDCGRGWRWSPRDAIPNADGGGTVGEGMGLSLIGEGVGCKEPRTQGVEAGGFDDQSKYSMVWTGEWEGAAAGLYLW